MPQQTRSSVLAIKEESSEGSLTQPTLATEFTTLREGFSMAAAVETVDSDELVNDIGASKSFITKEAPTASFAKYLKHSGVEGQKPDYSLFIKACLGSETVNATEYDIVSYTAGSNGSADVIEVGPGEGANFLPGQALLIKDGANGYQVRNVASISGDDLTLNYNLPSAPAATTLLGKAVHWAPAATGHASLSAHLYQAASSSALHQAMAGARVTSMSIAAPANELATVDFDLEGIAYFMNPLVVDSSNKFIDFTDDVGTQVATLSEATYKTPINLAEEIENKLNANSSDVWTVSFSRSTGKFTIASDGTTTELLWNTGANTANSSASLLGFSAAADDTGANSYESDSEQSYDAPVTPTFDGSDPIVVKNGEVLIGDADRNDCRKVSDLSISIDTPKQDVNSICSETGVDSSAITERTATGSYTILLEKHDVEEFKSFIENKTTQLMINLGPKSGGNWQAGKVMNIYSPQATITATPVEDLDGFLVFQVEFSAFVSATKKDIHINAL